jgi:hypothetical protein
VIEPASTAERFAVHPGQVIVEECVSDRLRRAPHRGQNAAPSKITAKHEGQGTAASRARQ